MLRKFEKVLENVLKVEKVEKSWGNIRECQKSRE
jgi:hypothetical protein